MPEPARFQSSASDDPRKTLDDLISRAIAYHSAPELKALLDFSRRFPYLAPYNAMLLHTQNPGIQYALSASQWERAYHRRIKPGARPYVILRTMGPVAFVFDLSDTEPMNPNDDRVPKAASNPFATNGSLTSGALEKMVKCCLDMAVKVEEQDFATGLAGKVVRNSGWKPPYLILLNSKHTEAQKLGTLAHELAHVLCGHLGEDKENKIPGRTNLTLEIREFEAEAVAYLVTDRLGLDIGSVNYLSGYLSAQQAIPAYSLDTALKVTGRIEQLMMGGKRLKTERFLEVGHNDSGLSEGEKLLLRAFEGLY